MAEGGASSKTNLPLLTKSIFSSDLGDDIVNDFLIPALHSGTVYKRVTGDFSSTFLVAAARGLSPFFIEGGRMYLITNGRFSERDAFAIRAGTSPEEVAERAILAEIDLMTDLPPLEADHIRALVWLLRNDRLEIQVSFPRVSAAKTDPLIAPRAVQHTKVGIIDRDDGKKIAFIGGINESGQAYWDNTEGVKACYSWVPGNGADIARIELIFDTLWNHQSARSYVVPFPEACKQKLISTYPMSGPPPLGTQNRPVSELPRTGRSAESWKHQDDALKAFLAERTGILEMATGTGKTRVALRAAQTLLETGEAHGVIIATRSIDLLDQWYAQVILWFVPKELIAFKFFSGVNESDQFVDALNSRRPAALLCTYSTLATVINRVPAGQLSSCLLVCDEVHNIGSEGNVAALRGKLQVFPIRLGLSATPKRKYDLEGTAFIAEEVGPVRFRYPLERAIEDGILCEFDYVPLSYDLTSEDEEAIQKAIAGYYARLRDKPDLPPEEMYRDIASVRKLSKSKLPLFSKYLEGIPEVLHRCLIFVETMDYGLEVQRIILPHSTDFHTYYGGDEQEKLFEFARGSMDCLITCKRISEGVDIQSIRNVVLFSSSRSELETIQRIGRCLRIDPANPNKRAKVVDFVVRSDLTPQEAGPEGQPADKERFDWLTRVSKTRRKV